MCRLEEHTEHFLLCMCGCRKQSDHIVMAMPGGKGKSCFSCCVFDGRVRTVVEKILHKLGVFQDRRIHERGVTAVILDVDIGARPYQRPRNVNGAAK